MKSLIIYKTKWGSTQQYAEWIKEKVPEADIYNIDDFDINLLKDYDRVVIGSRTYMGKIQVQDFLVRYWDLFKSKEVFLFTVGMIPWEKEDAKKAYDEIPLHITSDLEGHVKLPGRIDTSKISFFDKLIVKAMSPRELDQMDKKLIKPIVDFLKK